MFERFHCLTVSNEIQQGKLSQGHCGLLAAALLHIPEELNYAVLLPGKDQTFPTGSTFCSCFGFGGLLKGDLKRGLRRSLKGDLRRGFKGNLRRGNLECLKKASSKPLKGASRGFEKKLRGKRT